MGGFTDVIASVFEKDRGQQPVGNSSDPLAKEVLSKYSDAFTMKLQHAMQIKMVEIAHILQEARPEEDPAPVIPRKVPSAPAPAARPSSI